MEESESKLPGFEVEERGDLAYYESNPVSYFYQMKFEIVFLLQETDSQQNIVHMYFQEIPLLEVYC